MNTVVDIETNNQKQEFCHLHLHTDLSLLDGAMKIDSLFERCKELGFKKIAITDHGVITNLPETISKGKKQGIQVIPGCELYVSWDYPRTLREKDKYQAYHLVALAQNEKGYKNLLKLVSEAHLTGKYFKPRVDKELLERYSEGLIFSSACVSGVLARKYVREDMSKEEVKQQLFWFQEVFKDKFYLELQRHPNFPEQDKANDFIIELSKEFNIPLIATCDAHYLKEEHYEAWKTMSALSGMKGYDPANDYYVKTTEQMKLLFADIPEAISNTMIVANMCEPIEFDGKYKFPVFDTGKISEKEYLKKECNEGLTFRLADNNITYKRAEYEKRLEYELDIIHTMGFDGYMLVVADFINAAKRNNIPVGPGRGSAAGSLVCWVLRITEVDPIKYGLYFERFLNPDRVSMPDIDVDFGDIKRPEIIKYVEKKYGKDKVAQIATIGTMAARGALRDCARIQGVPYTDANKLSQSVPEGVRGKNVYLKTITDPSHEDYNPEFMSFVNSREDYKKTLEIALILEGMTRNAGVHAAGVVISDSEPLVSHTALNLDKEGNVVASNTKDVLEKLIGLIKFDFLGLSTLTTIERACEYIEQNHSVILDINKIPMDDQKTFDMLCSGNLTGVFQLSGSTGFRDVVIQIQPRSIEEISDITSLYRPGPLDNGFIPKYVKAKNTGVIEYMIQIKNELINNKIQEVLYPTRGVIIYQEQVMKLVQIMGGYTLAQADILRRIMGKKIQSEMEKQRAIFIEGCNKNNVTTEEANKAFDSIAKFAEYGFNKSHAIAYSIISYQTAYLRAHYPVEFMAAALSEVSGKRDKTITFLNDCKTNGIKILPPSINQSFLEYTPTKEGIRFGLGAVKSLGDVAVDSILKSRESGAFQNIFDFCSRVNLKKVDTAKIQTLIRAGCFDEVA